MTMTGDVLLDIGDCQMRRCNKNVNVSDAIVLSVFSNTYLYCVVLCCVVLCCVVLCCVVLCCVVLCCGTNNKTRNATYHRYNDHQT